MFLDRDPTTHDAGSVLVETVTGPIPVDALDVTSTHEHVIVDARIWWDQSDVAGLADAKVAMNLLGRLRHRPFGCKDNLVLSDEDVAAEELRLYHAAGGRTLLDPTPIGVGRDVAALRRISEASGVHIVAGTGFYVSFARPPEVDEMSVADIAAVIVYDITDGVEDTGVRCGFIGEIGITDESREISAQDEKLLRGAARAQALTRVPLLVHLVDPLGEAVLDLIEAEGGNVEATVLCHMPHTQRDFEYQMRLAERGVRLGYDLFGWDFYFPEAPQTEAFQSPSDEEMAHAVARLVEAGVGNQLLLSCDTATKMHLVRYGGCGYAHVIDNIVPRLQRMGVSDSVVRDLLVTNARSLFVNAALDERAGRHGEALSPSDTERSLLS